MIIFTKLKPSVILKVLFILIVSTNYLNAQNGKIIGTIYDKDSGDPLWGANVFIEGTSIGSATDMEGKYTIPIVPVGEHVLTVKYIGYQEQRIDVELPQANRTLVIDVELEPELLEGEEVVISAQAAGQVSAINQQLSSTAIKNVVSDARIQELPDATAAESIGRLPGVSINRSGGEANKVTVRGLAPAYNNVQIEGVSMGSTDLNNRSVDISMISPNALAGIEVTKALTPDMEASSLGGTINMTIRSAPKGLKYDILAQGGYDSQAESYNNFKIVGSISNRFMEDKLGIYFNAYAESRDRSTDILNANFEEDFGLLEEERDKYLKVSNINFTDREETRFRFGGAFVLDYKLPFGSLKFSNFASQMDQDIITHEQSFGGVDNQNFDQRITLSNKNITNQIVNKLFGKFDVGFGELDLSLSHSFSERDRPDQWSLNMAGGYTLSSAEKKEMHYLDYVNNVSKNPEIGLTEGGNLYVRQLQRQKLVGTDRAYNAQLNYKIPFKIGDDFINGSIKFGGLYEHQKRKYDRTQTEIGFDRNQYSGISNQILMNNLMAGVWTTPNIKGDINGTDAWDDHFDNSKFLDGKYDLFPFFSIDIMKRMVDVAWGYYDEQGLLPETNPNSFTADQDGREITTSGYIMSELKFLNNMVSFIPGIRYEKVDYEYIGVILEQPDFAIRDWSLVNIGKDTGSTIHENWFPMVHLKFQPTDWMDLRLAYTETVSRPNYTDITPYKNIGRTARTLSQGNINLKPQISENWDIIASVYSNEIGLFTLGFFKKDITDLIRTVSYNLVQVEDAYEFGLDETYKNWVYTATINNKFAAELKGIEISWQNNMWFLPTPFNGIVLDFNYTYIDSETKYPYSIIEKIPGKIPPQSVRIDTFYTGPIEGQPSHVLNLSIGYDYKGFSGRVSYLYQEGTISNVARKSYLSTYAFSYDRWDIKLQQKTPWDIEFFLNLNNITNTADEFYQQREFYLDNSEIWGWTMDLGVRYRL